MQSRPKKGKAPVGGTTEASSEANPYQKESNVNDSKAIQINGQPVFSFGDRQVRIIVREGAPWFVASDVCAALDYKNTSKAVADHLDEDERSNEQLDRSRMGSKSVVISESGLYALVLRSRKPEARKFAKWVTSEVLPSIRKTGGYERQDFAVNPGDMLTKDEAETLRLMLKSAADRLPKTKQGALMVQGWSKLKSHFKVGYREIPRHEFSEAVSIIARHTAEWEVVDDEPAHPIFDAEKVKRAFALASEVAQQAACTVFDALIDDDDVHKHNRWMFSLTYNQLTREQDAPWAKPIAHDQMLFSMADLSRRIVEPNSMIGTREELANVAMACMQKLSGAQSPKAWPSHEGRGAASA